MAMPVGLQVEGKKVLLTFTARMDKELAEDLSSYAVRACMIRWTHDYGTGEFKVESPNEKGWSTFSVASAKLLPDGKRVELEIPDLQPVHMMELKLDLETADGEAVITQINNTVHLN